MPGPRRDLRILIRTALGVRIPLPRPNADPQLRPNTDRDPLKTDPPSSVDPSRELASRAAVAPPPPKTEPPRTEAPRKAEPPKTERPPEPGLPSREPSPRRVPNFSLAPLGLGRRAAGRPVAVPERPSLRRGSRLPGPSPLPPSGCLPGPDRLPWPLPPSPWEPRPWLDR